MSPPRSATCLFSRCPLCAPRTHTHSLGLGKQTTSQLQAFRKRADDAKRSLALLQSQSADVDLAHYRGVLKVSRLCLA